MAKYLLLKHYRGAPAPVNDVTMDRWTPEEISAHVQYMNDFAARLETTGEFVDSQALAPGGMWVQYGGDDGRQVVVELAMRAGKYALRTRDSRSPVFTEFDGAEDDATVSRL